VKHFLSVLALSLAFTSVVSAQQRPANWNLMNAAEQAAWTSRQQPAKPASSELRVVAARSLAQVAVCGNGQRFNLPTFNTLGLTPSDVTTINRNNAADVCRFNNAVLRILPLDPVEASSSPEPVKPVGATTAAPASNVTGPPVATPKPATEATTPPPAKRACAENGSCYGDTSTATGKPKTTYVDGYTRKDGTYVRGHYRSK
jgi:hypothetical protein